MARTAPVPNIPAIPGMNPGIFVLGGGGDGGGSGAGDGKGKGAGQGAGGKNGGKGAPGDGKGAGSCGPGSGSGCSNPAHGGNGGTHAGDPVDPVTGRVYTIAQTDLPLVGPVVLSLQRAYSSLARERDVGLGFGWSHSLAWSIETRRRNMRVCPPFAEPFLCALPDIGQAITLRGVGRLLRQADVFVLAHASNGLVYHFTRAQDPSVFRLASIGDRAGNRITLQADERGALTGLTDSAGRKVLVQYATTGQIEGFELVTSQGRRVGYRRYEHDARGDLVATVDAEGRRVTFTYDDDHQLTDQVLPSGLAVHFRYDARGRCVETWTDRSGAPDPALDKDVPSLLGDGKTTARGMLHARLEYEDGVTIVYDSRGSRRVDHNPSGTVDLISGVWVDSIRYNDRGEMIAYEDPGQNRVSYDRDDSGRVVQITGPDGAARTRKYNDAGDLVEAAEALGTVLRYSRDGAGNLLDTSDAIGSLLRCSYDARGMRVTAETPDGGVTRLAYDPECNVIAVTEPNGRTRNIEVDDLGRVTAFTDEEGHRTEYRYDRTNTLRAIVLPNGGVAALDFDADGNLVQYTSPDGGVWRLLWGGYRSVYAVEKPTGEVLQLRYDREGNLVRIVNERGEEHVIERDLAGRIVAERHFDGRLYRYSLDDTGRIVRVQNGAEQTTELERDSQGRVQKRIFDDDTADVFETDEGGRLVRSESADVTCEWRYDARGNLLVETQSCAGRTVRVEHTYDVMNRRATMQTSLGHAVQWERDRMGRPTLLRLGPTTAIGRTYDGLGREVLRALPGGGHILCRYDPTGPLIERRVASPGAGLARDTPEWRGALPPGTTFAESLACSLGGDVIARSRSDGSREDIRYDLAGRVLERTTTTGANEAYAYAGSGCTLETNGPKRTYGAGGQLLSRGHISYSYDAEGRRSRLVDDSGAETRYEYDGRGSLASVTLPGGRRVASTYDAQGRRILKTVHEADGSVVETRFVWAEDDIVQEETRRRAAGEAESTVVSDRAYVFDDNGVVLAHRERTWANGKPIEGDWVHYARGPSDLPELLIAGDGAILAKLNATVWGAVRKDKSAPASTPWRFPGQYLDEETGLCQNRHRYYDPETGLYTTPDPLGLAGAVAAYEYADSRPWRLVDPEGMGGKMKSTVEGDAGSEKGTSGKKYNPDGSEQGLHPIVQAALPKTDANGNNPSSGSAKPGECAEPQALSKYIYKWEEKNGKLDPNNKEQVAKCLNGITNISAAEKKGDVARSPCPNCSQMFANLMDKYGAPSPSVIANGATTPGSGVPGPTNFEPPQGAYQGQAHQSYPIK